MRNLVVVALAEMALVGAACKREELETETKPQQTAASPSPSDAPSAADAPAATPCPDPTRAKLVKLGTVAREPIALPKGIVWADGNTAWYLGDGSDTPEALTKQQLIERAPPKRWRFETACGDGGCGPHGTNKDLVLVEGSKKTVVVKGSDEISDVELIGKHVVFSVFGPYGDSGGVFRAPKTGGVPEALWSGGSATELVFDGHDVFAQSRSGPVFIDLRTDKAVLLDKTSRNVRAIAIDADRVVWADGGNPYHASEPSGRILSMPRRGGDVVIHATEQPWPEVIALDDRRIYWGSRNRPGLWSVELVPGSPISEIVPSDQGCGGTTWMRRTSRGLVFVRGDSLEMRFGGRGEIWFVPL